MFKSGNSALEFEIESLQNEIADLKKEHEERKYLASTLKHLQTNLQNDKEYKKQLIDDTVTLGRKILLETVALSDT